MDNPYTGGPTITVTDASDVPGSNCPTGSTDPRCVTSIPVLIPALTITNTPSTDTATPGATVGYTLTITDSGQTAYTGITVTESFAQMLDDAAYDNDAIASTGTLSYTSPTLTWTGSLAAGASATVTFSVTANNPDTGDKLVIVTGTSAAPGSACPAGTTAAPCRSTVVVLTPALDIVATAGSASTVRRRHCALHDHDHQHRPDPVHRHHRHRRPDRAARRRRLQRRRYRHGRHRLLHQPGPDLDRQPRRRGRRHRHVHRHRQQPPHR